MMAGLNRNLCASRVGILCRSNISSVETRLFSRAAAGKPSMETTGDCC
jgi:hypothetical protein